jgi:hypothetical protein
LITLIPRKYHCKKGIVKQPRWWLLFCENCLVEIVVMFGVTGKYFHQSPNTIMSKHSEAHFRMRAFNRCWQFSDIGAHHIHLCTTSRSMERKNSMLRFPCNVTLIYEPINTPYFSGRQIEKLYLRRMLQRSKLT